MSSYASVSGIFSLLGSCCATGFCKIATAGTVEGARGVRCLLLWVNGIVLACAVLLMRSGQGWMGSTCSYISTLPFVGGEYGICLCEAEGIPLEVEGCRQSQALLRVAAAAEIEFLFLAILGISGCASGAGRSWPMMKFLAMPVLFFFLWFMPNDLFVSFRDYAGLVAAAFLVFQAVVVIDIMYYWNSTWFEMARQGRLRHDGKEFSCWRWLLVIFSFGFLGLGGYITYSLYAQSPTSQAIVFGPLAATLVLTFISLFECVKQGALIVSAAFVAFAQYVAWQVMSAGGAATGPGLAISATAAGITLIWAAMGQEDTTGVAAPAREITEMVQVDAETGERKEARVVLVQQNQASPAPLDSCDFVRACLTQSVATAYVVSVLLPSSLTQDVYLAHLGALVLSVVVYGWSLVAPKVLSGRSFE